MEWYPGHMRKTQQALQKIIKSIDVVVEIRDARCPIASTNPLFNKIFHNKKKVIMLNKTDLSDNSVTEKWVKHFSKTHIVIKNNINTKHKTKLLTICSSLCNRGTFEKPLRILLGGIPNVGKSTLINQLTSKHVAKIVNIAGTTKSIQEVVVSNGVKLYDTPGLTWQKLGQHGYNLALINAISRNAIDDQELAIYLITYLAQHYPLSLKTAYNIDDYTQSPEAILNCIALKRGCISANQNDLLRASLVILKDFYTGRLGKISLESPLGI